MEARSVWEVRRAIHQHDSRWWYFWGRELVPTMWARYMRERPSRDAWWHKRERSHHVRYGTDIPVLTVWCSLHGCTTKGWEGRKGWLEKGDLKLRVLGRGWALCWPSEGRQPFWVREGEEGVVRAVKALGGEEGWAWVMHGRGKFFRTKEGAERFMVKTLL